METTRQNKIARLLQKELSDIFLLQTKSMPGVLISVSAVRISPDLSVARAYLSIFPSEKAEEIIKNVNDNMKSIRYELGTRVRHQLRIIPELKFFVDDSLDYLEKIDELSEPSLLHSPALSLLQEEAQRYQYHFRHFGMRSGIGYIGVGLYTLRVQWFSGHGGRVLYSF